MAWKGKEIVCRRVKNIIHGIMLNVILTPNMKDATHHQQLTPVEISVATRSLLTIIILLITNQTKLADIIIMRLEIFHRLSLAQFIVMIGNILMVIKTLLAHLIARQNSSTCEIVTNPQHGSIATLFHHKKQNRN
jgi:hypothetical protein